MENMYGNCDEVSLNTIFLEYARANNMFYSHNEKNKWNLWKNKAGLILTFIVNKGKMIPCLVGKKSETMGKFYCSCSRDVEEYVREYVKHYLETLRDLLIEEQEERKLEPKVLTRRRRKVRETPIKGQVSFEDLL